MLFVLSDLCKEKTCIGHNWRLFLLFWYLSINKANATYLFAFSLFLYVLTPIL